MFSNTNTSDTNTNNTDSNTSSYSKVVSAIDNMLPNVVRDQIHPTPKMSEPSSTDLPHLPGPPVDEVKPRTAAIYPPGLRSGENVDIQQPQQQQQQPSMLQQMEQGVKGFFHKE
ncbi:hypothetical protein HDU77_004071 [Chytriomyces hyalinus]|nr:hypothetical protein HDU77_004071 [Chytriomyces hyalinus]